MDRVAKASIENGMGIIPEKVIAVKCPEFMVITNSKCIKNKSEKKNVYENTPYNN